MHFSSEFPEAHSSGKRPGFVWRAANRAAACFRAVTRLLQVDRPWRKSRWLRLSCALAGIACGATLVCYFSSRTSERLEASEESPYWEKISQLDLKNLATIGKNPYFNLEPGYRLRYTNGEATRTMTVRRMTKVIDGVQTRVVEEKVEQHGQPTKITWRYYAIDKATSALYCFGVHTQLYYKGRLMSHRGWRSGEHGAMFTLVMPAAPKVGDTLLRNHNPGSPRRLEEVIDVAEKVVTPAGTFAN